jgi:hypothetical protein
VAGLDAAEAGTGLGHDLAQGGFGLERHAAIVEPSPCSAACSAAGLGWLNPFRFCRGNKEGLSAPFRASGDFPCHTASCRMGAAGSVPAHAFDRLHLSNRCNQWIVLIASESVT